MFRNAALLASLVAIAGILVASSSQAASYVTPLAMANKLTFSKAVALPGVTLAAGTYLFESGPGGTNPNIVRVLSQNRQKLFYLGFTVPAVRPKGAPPNILTFGEAPNGEAPNGEATPITAWYPVGSNSGHEFMYR
jgi:hypothetical protein